MQHVDSPASQTHDRIVVSLALCSLAVVVRPGRWVPQARERRQEQGVLQPVVAPSARDRSSQRGARLTRRGTEARVGGELGCGREPGDVPDLTQDLRPEARTDPRQREKDRCLGQYESLVLFFERSRTVVETQPRIGPSLTTNARSW